ncbi:MAG: hypothetical protein KatS3mg020_0365 [Fimbriimonadales bacterium]|nr:MAG: hypothetical protein KatS3mg020_0365 [Fimbriimonadales bacterium]
MSYRHYYSVAIQFHPDYDWNPRLRGRCELPLVRCPQCHYEYHNEPFATLPEPVPGAVRRMLQTRKRKSDQEKAALPPLERLTRLFTVTPQEFAAIEQQVRQAYNLPSMRRVAPGTTLGQLYLPRLHYEPIWQVYVCPQWGRVIMTQAIRQRLERLEVANLLWFPVLNREGQPLGLWQLVVMGQNVLPEIDAGAWQQCPDCGRWHIEPMGHETVGFRVPESITDDFVYLEEEGLVVSERVVEVLLELGEETVWGLEFTPLDQRRKRLMPPTEEELREMEETLEEWRRLTGPPSIPE